MQHYNQDTKEYLQETELLKKTTQPVKGKTQDSYKVRIRKTGFNSYRKHVVTNCQPPKRPRLTFSVYATDRVHRKREKNMFFMNSNGGVIDSIMSAFNQLIRCERITLDTLKSE